jgi:hypothetical protein
MGPLADLPLAMLLVGASWALAALSLCGVGLLVASLLDTGPIGIFRLLRAFWLGLAAVVALLQILHFFVPIGAWTMGVVMLVGAIGVGRNGRVILGLVRRSLREHPRLCLAAAVIVAWLANRAIGPGNAHDSGLYHYSAILWIQSYSIVPGLGNLSLPLALGNASFLFTALLDSGPWRFRGEHLANGLLLGAFFVQVLVHAGRLFDRARPTDPAPAVFHLLLTPLLVLLAVSKEISSPKTDLPAAMLVFVLCAAVLEVLRSKRANPALLSFVLVIAAAAWCQKLSTAVIGGGMAALVAWRLADDLRTSPAMRKALGVGLLMSALLVVPWLGRNVITSGYPLFPAPWPAASVEWRIPRAAVDVQNDFTREHARAGLPDFVADVFERAGLDTLARWMARPEEVADSDAWVGRWLLSLPITSAIEVLMPIGLALLFGLLAMSNRPTANTGIGAAVWIVPALIAALLFWFSTAPLPRFGYAVTWSLAAVVGALVFARHWPQPSARVAARTILAIGLLCLPVLAFRASVLVIKDNVPNPLVMIPFLGPGPDHGFHPRPAPILASTRTRSGLTVAYPKRGWDVRCWTTLVCRGWPEIDPGLRQRNPYDPGQGFVTDATPGASD